MVAARQHSWCAARLLIDRLMRAVNDQLRMHCSWSKDGLILVHGNDRCPIFTFTISVTDKRTEAEKIRTFSVAKAQASPRWFASAFRFLLDLPSPLKSAANT